MCLIRLNKQNSKATSIFVATFLLASIAGVSIPESVSATPQTPSLKQFEIPRKTLSYEQVQFSMIKIKTEQVKKEHRSLSEKKDLLEEEFKQEKDLVEKSKKLEEKVNELDRKLKAKKAFEAERSVKISKNGPDSAGNAYAAGNCTWYVKSRRPDIGTHWGNANQWLISSQRDGFKTGSKPKIGAIGVTLEGWAGHVVYVESFEGHTVHISEMNYNGGLGIVHKRSVPASSFTYIYSL